MGRLKVWFSAFKEWGYQVVIAFNQLVNALHGGSADETICSRTWLNRHRYPYKVYLPILDGMFKSFQGPGHCEGAMKKEADRRHYSREMLKALADKN